MIIKSFELKKKNLNKFKYFLLYGNNQGLIEEVIQNDLKPNFTKNIFNYDEGEVITNIEKFKEELLNKSFFENEKLIIISRASDKIFKIIEEIVTINIEDISIIIKANNLEKKSKIRNLFEKSSNTICIPFYEDSNQSLSMIFQDFLKQKKINISQHDINLIIDRAKGDRINLKNELKKIESLLISRKKINFSDILKITNLAENYSASELVDNSLAKNKKKTLHILNENNFNSEDCVLILRVLLNKLKRLQKLKYQSQIKNNVDGVISAYKPPIFWKEKDIIKKQIEILEYKKIQALIAETSQIEYIIKKNPAVSVKILTNFILEQI